MKKINAFLFVICYLLMAKAVFADSFGSANITIDGKSIKCEERETQRYFCDKQNVIVVLGENGWVAINGDRNKFLILKPVQKIEKEKRVIYQSAQPILPYEDTQFNRIAASTVAIKALRFSADPLAKKYAEIGQYIFDSRVDANDKVQMVLNGNKESYQCTKGKSRRVNLKQDELQNMLNVKFECRFWSCVGRDPTEKVLMLLPKAGAVYASPSVMVMKNGQAKYFPGDFKVFDGSALPLTSVIKKYNEADAPGAPQPDLDPDLLIPSNYEASKSSYKYLLEYAKHGLKDTDNNADMCTTPGIVQDNLNEQNKIALSIQKNLSQAELVEYLKVIDGSIQSFYVDRKKGQKLGCLYQDKIVDNNVLGRFDHLKEISTLKSTTKFLSVNEVQDLFQKAKNMKDIPFGYKYDGCYARAHVMSKRFEEMGIPTQKVWIKGSLYVPNTDIQWSFHVAPIVEVKDKNGNIVKYVIDPSVIDKAVPLDEWVAAIGKKTKGPIMKTTYPFPGNGLDFDRASVAISSSDVYGPQDIPGMSSQEKMDLSKQVLQEFSEVLASQGK
jgi:hypothetical protein